MSADIITLPVIRVERQSDDEFDWVPIETPPPAGTEVDIWCRNIANGSTDQARFPAMFLNDDGEWEDWRSYVLEPKWRPTHWRLPPTPPAVME